VRLNCAVIVEKIKETRSPFYRPELPHQDSDSVHPDILTLMKHCWAEEPSDRPSFYEIAKSLRIINKGKLVLHCLSFMQRYCALQFEDKYKKMNVIFRPPVYGSNGRTYKMLVMFSFFFFLFFRHAFSEFPRPIALKLCHMAGICVYFIMQVQNLGGGALPPKNGGQKHAKFRSILDHFRL